MSALMTTTYSMWRLFRNCRKACELRYFDELVPLEKDGNLSFGSLIHNALEKWHSTHDTKQVLELIDAAYPDRIREERELGDWNLATAMMTSYAECYPTEEFEVVALEKNVEGPIVNPDTGSASRSFVLAGKVDGIVKQGEEYFLLEHKSASQIDASYLERLWTDFQIILYAGYLEQTMGIRISGVIYNVLVKAKLRQSKGETEEEYQTRLAELIAKSKTGKSSAKRKLPETDTEFQERLAEKYKEPGMFHREVLYISRDQFAELRGELWELSQALLDARRRKAFYKNTSYCFQYNRPCAYFPLCSSGGNPNVIENLYQKVAPHEELREGELESTPQF